MNHVSVSPTDGNGPTQGQRKTLTRVGIEPPTFGLDHRCSTDGATWSDGFNSHPGQSFSLTWNDHVTEISKASKRLYFLTQLKKTGVPKQDLALFYVSCVGSVIDYATPVFFNGLPQYLKNELVRLEKRAMSIMTSGKCNSWQ